MEIDKIFYKAKDGRIFTDPLECEDYEKTIGILPGSVGDLIRSLEEFNPDGYIFGIAYIKRKDGDGKRIYARCTVCCDHMLESFTNVGDLREEQRYFVNKVCELISALREDEDMDSPVRYMFYISDNITMEPGFIMAARNDDVWDENYRKR